MGYAALWVKSNFSFLEGASHPEELVEQAHALGLGAIALTDRDGVYGVVRAHMRAQQLGIPLLVGAEVTLPGQRRVVLLCEDRRGYGNLCQLLSRGRLAADKGSCLLEVDDVCEFHAGLVALCPDAAPLATLRASFGPGRLYALVARHLHAEALPAEAALRAGAARLGVPTVAAVEVLYHGSVRQPLQDVLTCIRHGVPLSGAGRLIRGNAEHDLKPERTLRELFHDDPAALARTLEVAERCRFSLSELRYRYPAESLPKGLSEQSHLSELTIRGAAVRYPGGIPDEARVQIERELSIIERLQYGGYFLTMWEIVQFCRRSDILCQGRGSAANSVVCYCLGITAIDPIKLDLLFERFLSEERAEPPDIDLDIEHARREEVIAWVYERYGRRHAAMVCNVIRYRMRSAMREVGKVLGLPMTAVDRLSKLLGARFDDLGSEALCYAGLDPDAPVHQHFVQLVQEIQDFPRHLSIHPGGFLLGHEPVDTLVPIEPGAMEGRTVIQWDKYAIEDLGLFKVDLLGLGALTHLHHSFDLLRAHHRIDLSMATIPHGDADTYAMISRGDTVGTFQIESRAQMSMLPRLRPETFYDLVIEVAIVRPGPIQGDMVHPYLLRRSGKEAANYPHPALRRVLEKTLGVPIFQEQVMKIAILVGGYSPGEADQLRRDMAAWKSSGRIERHHARLTGRMIENGLTPEYAERIFSQIRGFGEYGFPESHAASFALIAYATAWLRCHHPAAFLCGLLNAQPMGFYSPATLVEDGKRHGLTVLPIDVQHSRWDCTLETHSPDAEGERPAESPAGALTTATASQASPARSAVGGERGPDAESDRHAESVAAPERDKATGGLPPEQLRMGLRYIKGFGTRERLAFEHAPPPYRDLEDLVRRTRISMRACQRLAEAGALSSLIPERRDAIWALREIYARREDSLDLAPARDDGPLFAQLSPGQAIQWDYRVSQHSTRGHPMQQLRGRLRREGIPAARALNALPDGTPARYVGMTICRQRPGTATGVTFYTLEDETGFVNLVVWRDVFERHSIIARTAVLMGVQGHIQSESGVIHLIAESLWEPDLLFRADGTTQRSFH